MLYTTPPNTADRVGLIQVTQPYTKSYQVHDCPSADMKSDSSYLGNRSYGYNPYLMNNGACSSLGLIARPAEVVMLADVIEDSNAPGRLLTPAGYGPLLCAPDGTCATCGTRHNSVWDASAAGPHSGNRPGFNVLERHNGMANCAFSDGHAKAMKHFTLYNNRNDYPYFSLN